MTTLVPSVDAGGFDAHESPSATEGGETRMTPSLRRVVGGANALGGVVALTVLVGTYGVAEELVAAQERATSGAVAFETVDIGGVQLQLSLAASLLLVGAAAGFLGSMVQQSIVFANRAGKNTLESTYVWWYVLRPVWSALLGSVVVLAVNAGLVSIGDETTSTAGVTVLVTAAAVAGLFTDQALNRLRRLTGAGDPDELGSQQTDPASASVRV